MVRWLAVALVLSCVSSVHAEASPPRLLPGLELTLQAAPVALGLGAAIPAMTDADPQPSTGVGMIVAGWILGGIGVLNLATLPLCYADFYPSNAEDLCVALSAVIGGLGLGIGIPLLIVGYNNRSDYKDWQRRHGQAALPGLRLAFDRNAALVIYSAEL
jgi:hypothetical protein